MSDEKVPDIPERATQAVTRPTTVPLNEFVLIPDRFCHRDPEELSEEARLKTLMDSLTVEGLQTPVEFYRDAQGRAVVTKGHRRITAMRFLAQKNTPGFSLTMPVEAMEVVGATQQDLVVRSILDNENRLGYSQTERIRAAKTLHESGVQVERAAYALRVSPKTYQRDLLVAQHDWMFQLVLKNAIAPTTAAQLLEGASKEKRLAELETDLTEWVADTEHQIEEKAHLRKLKGLTDLRPAERLVKNHMTRELVTQWVVQLKNKERFAKEVAWDFGAGIDPESNKLQIEAVKVDLGKAPLDHLAKVASKLSRVSQGVLAYLKKRHELEAPKGPQDVVRQEGDNPYDLEVLRKAGLTDLADELELGLLLEEEQTKTTPPGDNPKDATEGT